MPTQSSSFFTLNQYVVMEYIYNDGSTYLSTALVHLRRITNTYTGVATMVNDDNSAPTTGNVTQYTVQRLADGSYVLLDSVTGYYYPNYDSNVVVNNLTVSPVLNVVYDTVRFHILAGYNFQDLDGFIVELSALTTSGKYVNLCDFTFLKSDSQLLFFNPNPLKMQDFIFDKYVEIKVMSQNAMVNQQNLNPLSTTILSYYVTGGSTIVNQQTLYCTFTEVDTTAVKNGILYLNPGNKTTFAFDSYDKFNLLVAFITENTTDGYFIYYGQYNGIIIDNFIYELNAVAGNKFILIHDIRVIEQSGAVFVQTSSLSNVQTTGYDQEQFFKPILQTPDIDVSFSIEYTLRLYNTSNGRSIFKIANITSTNVGMYGRTSNKLYVDNVSNPLKIYNKLVDAPVVNIVDNSVNIVKTNTVIRYVNQNNIVVQNNGVSTPDASGLVIALHPFSNIIGLHITQTDSSGKQTVFPLDNVSTYNLAFVANDGSKLYISEYSTPTYQHVNGDIAFMVTDANVQTISFFTNKNFYLVASTSDGIDTIVGTGTYTITS